jgi:hypothetical protein
MKTRQALILLSACLMAVAAAGCARIETRPVWFLSDPKTPDEHAVAKVLEGLITAFNDRNYDQLSAYYAPEAKIESLAACGVVSREQHRAAVIANKYLPKEELGNTRIKMASPDEARAEGELRLLYSWGPDDSSGPHAYAIVYSLIRRDGQWLVIEEKLPGVWLFKLARRQEKPYGSVQDLAPCQPLFT